MIFIFNNGGICKNNVKSNFVPNCFGLISVNFLELRIIIFTDKFNASKIISFIKMKFEIARNKKLMIIGNKAFVYKNMNLGTSFFCVLCPIRMWDRIVLYRFMSFVIIINVCLLAKCSLKQWYNIYR